MLENFILSETPERPTIYTAKQRHILAVEKKIEGKQ